MTTPTLAPTNRPSIALTPLDALHAEIRACRAYQTAGYLTTANPLVATSSPLLAGSEAADSSGAAASPPPLPGEGAGGRGLMLIGQAPSQAAIREWQPFAGVGGRRLFEWLSWAGFDEATFRHTTYVTAMTKCFPGPHPKGKGDRKPSAAELALCRPFLDRQIALVDPGLILLVGGLAIEAFLGKVRLDAVVGQPPIERAGRLFLPLPHPSGVSTWLNDPAHVALVRQAMAHLRNWLDEC